MTKRILPWFLFPLCMMAFCFAVVCLFDGVAFGQSVPTTVYRGQPNKIILFNHDNSASTEITVFSNIVSEVNTYRGNTRRTNWFTVNLGSGRFTNNTAIGATNQWPQNLIVLGAGTNLTYLFSTNQLLFNGGCFTLHNNQIFQDFDVQMASVLGATPVFENFTYGQACTNVFINRVSIRAESGAIYASSTVAIPVDIVVSNSLFYAKNTNVLLHAGSSSNGRFQAFNTYFESKGPPGFGTPVEVLCFKALGTNNVMRFVNNTVRLGGSTNHLFAAFLDAARILWDNCSLQFSTNGVARDPATSVFAVYQTNALAESWFLNMVGPATNRTTGQGNFHVDRAVLFKDIWP